MSNEAELIADILKILNYALPNLQTLVNPAIAPIISSKLLEKYDITVKQTEE